MVVTVIAVETDPSDGERSTIERTDLGTTLRVVRIRSTSDLAKFFIIDGLRFSSIKSSASRARETGSRLKSPTSNEGNDAISGVGSV